MAPYLGLVGVRFVLSPPNRDGKAEVNVPFIGAARTQPYDCVSEPDSLVALETRDEEYSSFFLFMDACKAPLGRTYYHIGYFFTLFIYSSKELWTVAHDSYCASLRR